MHRVCRAVSSGPASPLHALGASRLSTMYDLIGDIHGHATELVLLLEQLGYERRNGVFSHPQRKVIFLGDLIDRGPQIQEVLDIARPMVEQGYAHAILGNHELNALGYHTPHPKRPGRHLRERNDRTTRQHEATLRQLDEHQIKSALEWFRTLPLWLDLDGLRAVHACWDDSSREALSRGLADHGGITNTWLHAACVPGAPLFSHAEVLLKGKEAKLPHGIAFFDKDGHERRSFRTRWYSDPRGQSYRSYALETAVIPSTAPLAPWIIDAGIPYPSDAKPVFFGHYWLRPDRPSPLASNVACLDYSIGKGGLLCAYRWNGEQILREENFSWIPSVHSHAHPHHGPAIASHTPDISVPGMSLPAIPSPVHATEAGKPDSSGAAAPSN